MGCGSSNATNVDERAHLPPVPTKSSSTQGENGVHTPHAHAPAKVADHRVKADENSQSPADDNPPSPCIHPPDGAPVSSPIEPGDDLQHFFIEFPTPHLLWEANKAYGALKRPLPRSGDKQLLPYPLKTQKAEVFHESKYEAIDKFAIGIDQSSYSSSLETFTSSLIQQYRKDEMAKVRVIFRWLAAQDINKYGQMSGLSMDTVLWHLQGLLENPGLYSDIFLKMCSYAGIRGQLIRGYAKHARLEPGADPKAEDVNTWVAVVVNDQWRLVDPHWGSSHMVGNDPGEWLLIDDNGQGAKNVERGPDSTAYACNEVYFLTNPEQFIYSHIPQSEESLQLLARPVTLREFTEMAYLKPAFFDLDLKLLEHRNCVLYSSEGEIDFQIGTPPGKRRSFMYRLWMSNAQSMDDIKLERFCIMQQKNNTLFCRIYFPTVGKFKLELFARDADVTTAGNYCKQVCAFIIHCDKPAEGVKAFPENNRREWGPGPDLQAAGLLSASHDDAVIEAEDGTVVVRFKAERAVEILHHLHSNTKTKEELKGQIVHYMDNDKGELVVYIRLPETGDYALNLFTKDEGTPGIFPNVCSYIVSTENPAADPRPYPTIANGRIGSLVANKDLNVKLISHDSPLIQSPETGELDLVFEANKPCETLTSLELNSPDGNLKKENYTWTVHDENKINIKIRFPEPGIYAFNLFAKETNAEGTYPHVYTCLLNAPIPMENCVPFPTTFLQWKPGCDIMEPTSNVIQANSTAQFAIKIPHAHQVAAIDSNDEWSNLERDADGVWKGEVKVTGPGQVKISAEVDKGSDNFTTVLMYKVEEEEDLKQEEEKRHKMEEQAKKQNEADKLKKEKDLEKRQKDFENAKKDLQKALESRDLVALRKALKVVERKKYVGRLQTEVEAAKKLIKSLERIQGLKQAILKMDQNTMLEMRNYQNPPKGVHEVMIATLLLLGDSEKATKDWSSCQKCLVTIGKDGLHRRITNFDVTSLHPEIAARALKIIGKFRLDDVSDTSSGAGTFYGWTAGMIEEARLSSDAARKAPPANISRQVEIFSGKAHKQTTN